MRSNVLNVIGKQVNRIRTQQMLTQTQLAAKVNLLDWDISRGTLAKIESGIRRLTDIEVMTLAKALKVEVQVLFPVSK